jgi:hypothetical protein
MQELIYNNKTVLLPPNLCQSWIATDTDFIAALRLSKRVESLYIAGARHQMLTDKEFCASAAS